MKQAVITGVAGFLGSCLAKTLLTDNGYSVTGIDNISTGRMEKVKRLTSYPNFTFIEGDICSEPLIDLEILQNVEEIYHLASPASPKMYQKDPLGTISVNTIGTKNMLELAKRTGAKLLYSSTSEIYGDPLVHPQPETYRGNVTTCGPRACYDESKRLGEVYCYLYHTEFDTKVTVARIFNTYSSGLAQYDGRVISNLVTQALTNKELTIYGDGMQTRSFCYVDDTIRGFQKMMGTECATGEIYNIGHPEEYTILEVAELIKKLTGSCSPIVFKDLPIDDPQIRCPDISKAMKQLDWKPEIDLQEGLKRTIAEYRRQLGKYE
ncbi:GDP-mannose 4,6-dehydratase [Alkalihalobacillus sp. AL-G]|uniref:GDP-mannose 4,6-dehydratase n=1 Tax=Alkalihalobacillus sp. AL-G TaxID=2926399 RepID=UPI00272D8710|nr:GDP-mannose 4,6-dehydratase [Alkalihalobacillus sp. AL-G]WLD94943.1 GDP-mannose 4,6-dehydratase [Alkalihalobacillus sp. AL-G]